MNLVYDISQGEEKEIAERVRTSTAAWEAVEHWARRRLGGGDADAVNQELIDTLEKETHWYVNNPCERAEPEAMDDDGPWEAA